jgi:uncharacterized protein YbjT (DUF2867 family)
MKHETRRTAVVAGATGLIGSELLRRLLACRDYGRVIALTRRTLGFSHPKLGAVPAEFDRLDATLADAVKAPAAVDVFCCLGTTIPVAGSEEAFRRVDHDFVFALGRWALRVDARRMIVVSALAANAASTIFYNRVKGETERDLAALGLRSLVIVRPSLLTGRRSEFRLGERIALAVSAPLRPLIPSRVRPIAATDVAQAMIDAALADKPPRVIESAVMQGAARRSARSQP